MKNATQYPKQALLVCGSRPPDELLRKLHIRERISCGENIERIEERIVRYGSVVLMDVPPQLREQLLLFCFARDIVCRCVSTLPDILVRGAREYHIGDVPVLLLRNRGLSWRQRICKRVFDVTVSLGAVVLSAPLMLAIAACIRLSDGGPVLFTQERLTEGGKRFRIIKFRSMSVQKPEAPYCLTRKRDERVTPVGRFIRNTHLDELPQLFNVLRGDMSLVGPRPECPQLAEKYSRSIPEFDFRLKVRAGMTGYAQVYGKYSTPPREKLKLDLSYIENYSFFLDVKLVLRTFTVLFRRENAEGIEPWQTDALGIWQEPWAEPDGGAT